ncbi:MAG: hypothetical protein PHI12_06975 [Dehalococcoidales bacterium]|nr:hypothetical protein [Dehalococcoidales bacterium]
MISTICLASFDLPSHSSSAFVLRYIVPRCPVMLYGPMAQPGFFGLTSPISDFILGTGHGSDREYCAQNESIIWKVGEYNPGQVRGKVVKLLSCNTGMMLGPDLIKNGARAYLGYDDDFLWIADSIYYPVPWEDRTAAACLMPVIQSLNALLDGSTCAEAIAIERQGYLQNIERTDNELLSSLLEHNNNHTVIYGDQSATITPRPKVTPPIPPPPLLL